MEPPEGVKGAIKFIELQMRAASNLETCPLETYREIACDLPHPTERQIEDFVAFVAQAHSWYKHLPLLAPGRPFQFFLDPYAGFERNFDSNGQVIHRERVKGDREFHYTWMTTADYRKRFGHLDYDARAGTSTFLNAGGAIHGQDDMVGAVFGTSDGAYRIPPEVARAGLVAVTGLVHPYAASRWIWDLAFRTHPEILQGTDEEADLLRQVHAIYEAKEDEVFSELIREFAVPGLPELLAPERARIRQKMVESVCAMLRFVYD